jgi:signal transduction histidine kinase
MTMYAADRTVIASSISPPLSPKLIDDPSSDSDLTFSHAIRDGDEVISVVMDVRRPKPTRLLAGLAILLAALLLLCVLLVRHIGRPLERIAGAARRFGRGDLTARASLRRKDELGEVGRAFDEMADRVTLLMSTQRELMANVSHELQTPLARVQVAVDLMADGVEDQVRELLPELTTDLDEVQRLIGDVMTLARFDLAHAEGLTAGAPLRCEAVALATLVERACARFRATYPRRELVVLTDAALPIAWIDPVLILRVLDNLLDNGRKYSEPDSTLTLTARAIGGGVTLAVGDRGIGIDTADLPRVGTAFFRTDRSRSRATGGVGLGLVLARRVIEAHGGTIAIHSKSGAGTTVTCTLPPRPPPA